MSFNRIFPDILGVSVILVITVLGSADYAVALNASGLCVPQHLVAQGAVAVEGGGATYKASSCGSNGDTDRDGVLDSNDNCPNIKNASQVDLDTDGFGDPCDNDDDIDGVIDTVDNCVGNFNPWQHDSDNDGVGDQCDGLSTGAVATTCSDTPGPVIYEQPLDSYATAGAMATVGGGDIDGDGNVDFVGVVAGNSSLRLLKNDVEGSGSFTLEGLPTGISSIATNAAIAITAVDAGANDDIILWPGWNGLCAASPNCKKLSVLRNYNQNSFSSVSTYTIGAKPGSIATGDLDGDGDKDIVTGNFGDDTMSILLNDGSGEFAIQAPAINFNLAPFPTSNVEKVLTVRVGDMDCDGDQDIVMSFINEAENSGVVRVLTNQQIPNATGIEIPGGGAISLRLDATYNASSGLGVRPAAMALGDMEQTDGIDDLDIVVGSSAANGGQVTMTVLYNDRCGGAPHSSVSYPIGYDEGMPESCQTEVCLSHRAYAVALGDFDVDGDNDIVVTSGSELLGTDAPFGTFMFNNSSGQFSVPVPQSVCISNAEDARPVLAEDVNGDGKVDVIVGDVSVLGGESDISIIRNLTEATSPAPIIAKITSPSPTLPSLSFNWPGLKLSASGMVIGNVNNQQSLSSAGFEWKLANGQGQGAVLPGLLTAYAVNDLEQVVGLSDSALPVVLTRNGPIWEENVLPEGIPLAINNAGTIVAIQFGNLQQVEDQQVVVHVRSDETYQTTNLHNLVLDFYGACAPNPIDCPSVQLTWALDINQQGLVVGGGYLPVLGRRVAYVYDTVSSQLVDLPAPEQFAGYERDVWAVSDQTAENDVAVVGTVSRQIGCSEEHLECCFDPPIGDCFESHFMVWEGSVANGFSATELPLTNPSCDHNLLVDVNAAKSVIGVVTCNGDTEPMIWKKNMATDTWSGEMLHDLLQQYDPTSATQWNLSGATSINAAGQIVGSGQHNGSSEQVGYLLSLPQ